MKNPLTHRVSSADRSVSLINASTRVSALIPAGLLLCVGMITGCSEPTARGGISEPDPERSCQSNLVATEQGAE